MKPFITKLLKGITYSFSLQYINNITINKGIKMENGIKLEIIALEASIPQWREAYYNGTSIVNDEVYDNAEDRLRELKPDSEVLNETGAEITGDGTKREHKIAMGSQAKTKITDDGIADVIARFIMKGKTIVSHKMDGISFATDYENGKLLHSTTRGNGFIGEDIPNPTEFKHINATVNCKDTFTARGELVVSYEDFETINSQLADEDKFANPRNAASGIARKANSPFRKYITAYYYDAVLETEVTAKEEIFEFLTETMVEGSVVPYWVGMTGAEFEALALDLDVNRKELPYMIDGLVIEFNDLATMKKLGVAGGNKPKGSIALKFNPIAAQAPATTVVWQVGSTGDICPVAEFAPTLVDGSVIRRASIHNYEIFKSWNLAEGDMLEVQKNNDIIPQIKSVISRSGNKPFEAPTECPVCGSTLEITKEHKTAQLHCSNEACKAKAVGFIKKWVDKTDMNKKGVGEAFIDSYLESYDTVEELYSLTVSDVMKISSRYKERSATKIVDAIQASKGLKLMDFFGGLNIHGTGSRTFKKFIDLENLTTVDEVLAYVKSNDLTKVKGLGGKAAKCIEEGLVTFADKIENLKAIVEIEKVVLIEEAADAKSFLFTGKILSINEATGKAYTRKDMVAMVTAAGHVAGSSVNKDLDYLVTADPDSKSAKMQKARDKGVNVIGEDEFFSMMK
jgi:DNA ligase (NAD+)